MATLIPALGACVSRMTAGERRLAERLEQKLDDDYLLWYDVPMGPHQSHPDFCVIHPRRGLLILEVKDWKPDTILQADKLNWVILDHGQPKTVASPIEQARQYAHTVVDALKRDPQLVQAEGKHQGQLAFPWSYGVVFPNLTRKQFTEGELHRVIEPNRVVCRDEMTESVDAEDLQSRLWGMFPFMMGGVMSLPQLDRVRWIMFPEVRLPTQGTLFDDSDSEAELPGIMRVMDLQQEQLARSLGDGHRVIHGVAGSGKTMILGYRAEYLAKAHTATSKPILILCFNEPLGVTLHSVMQAKGLADKVHARHFHKWCRDQLVAYGQTLPAPDLPVDAKMADMVQRVIRAVDRKQIPSGQYQAILIDEGHDFAPEWLKLVTQMVDPTTNSLLLLYDDAQSIYERARSKQFSFKSLGIQAQGRTTILKINYRNTKQILQTASLIAKDLLTADDKDDDGIPLVKPISCGRDGQAPLIIRLPCLRDEAYAIADHLANVHKEDFAWGDMAVLCADWKTMDLCASALAQRKLPHRVRKRSGDYHPGADAIQVMTMKVSKGLEFPVVALPGVGHMPAPGEDEKEAARVFYVAATRATQRLVIGVGGDGGLAKRFSQGDAPPHKQAENQPFTG
ncbi:MAG: NERD domain-containing protein [Gammaproteobacteria bacterium]|uniref:DEAD/DEAH box helicase n=1 Tax=Rhodoferax sp. TaxID=50421 RepID=UPI001DCB41CB|nr:3'-5' exonuclease [Rhodoferax sp.]MBU3898350.1 NERD domain-containing protein [Gammaproteobacteria bacterium]MBU3996183.1 NERD domain-containing protein [Gammaproteobacteria bacterium]MBU4081535.1 NERD domain-containing protein [Gammaproteobacteria bacterium]MBU4114914.1 NERD domain-containing protein [Gammaproteobacteria bacterium]MBU4170175.1 NERD domain-containing protein [Gammaproteobacteria bacterium]